MRVGICEYELFLPLCHSLKEKRSIIKSLLQKLQHKFHISACEAANQDVWQRATVGVAVVSNEKAHIEQMLEKITHFIDIFDESVEITHIEKEIL